MGYSTVKKSVGRLIITIMMAALLVIGITIATSTVSKKATQGAATVTGSAKLAPNSTPPPSTVAQFTRNQQSIVAKPVAQVIRHQQWECSGSGVGRTCTYTWKVGVWQYGYYVYVFKTKTCVNTYDSYYNQYYWNCSTS